MAADACRPVRVRHREGESVVVVDELDDAQARLGRTQFVEQRRPLRVVDGHAGDDHVGRPVVQASACLIDRCHRIDAHAGILHQTVRLDAGYALRFDQQDAMPCRRGRVRHLRRAEADLFRPRSVDPRKTECQRHRPRARESLRRQADGAGQVDEQQAVKLIEVLVPVGGGGRLRPLDANRQHRVFRPPAHGCADLDLRANARGVSSPRSSNCSSTAALTSRSKGLGDLPR